MMHAGSDPVRVQPGDLAITRGPDHYRVGDHPDSEPTIEIHPGQVCRSLTGEPLEEAMSLGVRSWGNHHEGDTVMMVGAYHSFGEIGDRLVRGGQDPERDGSHVLDLSCRPVSGDDLTDDLVAQRPEQIEIENGPRGHALWRWLHQALRGRAIATPQPSCLKRPMAVRFFGTEFGS